MAKIILAPTAQSKVIPLSLRLNDTDTSLVSQLVTNRQFSTADTDAWFGFTLEGLAATTGTFDLTLINLQDKSVFNHTDKMFNTNPFYYKLDSGTDELTNEIRHAGKWVGQLVVTLANGDSATRKFIFGIEGHILDGTVVQTILLEDYNALISDIESAKDELTQYNIDYSTLISTVESQEAARVQAELTREQTFNALVDSEIIAQNVATKLTKKEATFAPRLLSAEQQLAEAKADLQAGIGAVTADSEVVTARSSTVKGKVFSVIDARFEDIESDSYLTITNLIANGDFDNGSTGFSLTGTTPPTLTASDTKKGRNAIEINTANASSIVTKDVVTPIGSKIYVGAWVKILSFTEYPSADIVIEINDIGSYNNPVYVRANKNIIGEWQYVSGIKTTTVAGVKVCGGHTGATTRNIRIDGLITIDLSATFGTGHEPNTTQMDLILSNFTDNWFDGTKKLLNAKQITAALYGVSQREIESTGDGVVFGMQVLPQTVQNMSVKIGSGIVHMPNGKRFNPIANNAIAIAAANATNPRIDIVYVNSVGEYAYLAGASAVSPTVPTLPSGGFLLAQIAVAANQTTITSANITDKRKPKWSEQWIIPTLVSSWVAYDTRTAKYKKTQLGRVYLKGMIKNGTIGQTIFTLPTGYRPDEALVYGYITINTNGTVVCTGGTNTAVSLSGISFDTN